MGDGGVFRARFERAVFGIQDLQVILNENKIIPQMLPESECLPDVAGKKRIPTHRNSGTDHQPPPTAACIGHIPERQRLASEKTGALDNEPMKGVYVNAYISDDSRNMNFWICFAEHFNIRQEDRCPFPADPLS
jgi:hypothetical protein